MSEAVPRIREENNKGKSTRFVVDYGRDRHGKRIRRTFNSSEEAQADITRDDVTRWLRGPFTQRREGLPASPLSRKHYLTVVGGLFNFAIEQEYIKNNPLDKKSRRRRVAAGSRREWK